MKPATRLEAGFGRSDITPRPGIPLAGFGPYLNRQASDILAPLHSRAAYFRKGEESLLMLSLELCGLSNPVLERVRWRVMECTGLREDRIFISTTHTHSGPQTVGHIGWGHPDDLYLETLPIRAATAAAQAVGQAEPVEMRWALGRAEGIAINREYDRAYDRSLPVETFLKDDWRPPRPELTDPRVWVLGFFGEGVCRGILHAFSCHPVVCCEQVDLVHGDFVGLASQNLEERHPQAVALFLPGALGDINPCVAHRAREESLCALPVIAGRYTRAVHSGVEMAKTVEDPVLASRQRSVILPRVGWTLLEVEERIAELEAALHQPGVTDDPLAGEPVLQRRGMQMVRLSGLRLLRARIKSGIDTNPPAVLHGLRLGPLRLLGVPFELFQATRREVETQLGDETVALLSLVNGALGYAPDPDSFARQGYAAEFVPLMKGDPPHDCLHPALTDALVALGRDLE